MYDLGTSTVRRPELGLGPCATHKCLDEGNLNSLGKPGNSCVEGIKKFNDIDHLVFCQKITCTSVLIVTFCLRSDNCGLLRLITKVFCMTA